MAQTQPATRPAVKPLPKGVEKLADIVYGHAGDIELKLDLYRQINRPAEPLPVILCFHGGVKGEKYEMMILEFFNRHMKK